MEKEKVKLYVSRTCGNSKIKNREKEVERILQCKLPTEELEIVEVTEDEQALDEKKKRKIDTPFVCRGCKYIGDYDAVFDANECGSLHELLGCKKPEGESQQETQEQMEQHMH